jgi:hypothetical protein
VFYGCFSAVIPLLMNSEVKIFNHDFMKASVALFDERHLLFATRPIDPIVSMLRNSLVDLRLRFDYNSLFGLFSCLQEFPFVCAELIGWIRVKGNDQTRLFSLTGLCDYSF